jgi:glutamate-1-semialdehyde 2,1-aminomutase
VTTTTRTDDLLARADATIAGGAITQFALPGGERRVLARGEGARVWDVDGREYVDYVLGSGPLVVGHCHPRVVEAAQRQAAVGPTFYALNEPIVQLAERIVERVPCAELVQFSATGAEATFYALRLARAATGRDGVLKFEGGFHGSSDYAQMSLFPVGPPAYPAPEPTSSGIPRAIEQDVLVAPFNDLEATRAIVEAHADRLAAIIVEPLQRVIEPQPGFLEGLRALADRHGIVLVFDEIVTGFRLAAGGAQERYGVTPDLATFGKIIGGGYALAAVAGRRDLLETADHSRRGGSAPFVYISGTLNGNPVAAAAGLATLDVLDEPGAYERLDELGDRMRAGLERGLADAGLPGRSMGAGPMFQAVVVDGPVTDYRSMRRADAAAMRTIMHGVLEAGNLIQAEKAYLSLAHADADVDRTLEAFAESAARYAHSTG